MWDKVSPRLTVWRVTLGFGFDAGFEELELELLLEELLEELLLEVLLLAIGGGGALGRRHLEGSSAQSSR